MRDFFKNAVLFLGTVLLIMFGLSAVYPALFSASLASNATYADQEGTRGYTLPAGLNFNQPYIQLAWDDAQKWGLPPGYFVRQIQQESGFRPRVVSSAGAIGIAQFMPSTAAGIGVNPWDPVQSLNAAAQYMATKLKYYGGDYRKALASYNAGSGRVQYGVDTCGQAKWLECMSGETQHYVQVIYGW